MTPSPPAAVPAPAAPAVAAPDGVPPVILIAPNVSEKMGGEAIKALQIWQTLDRLGVRTYQITHHRVQWELKDRFPRMQVSYVADSALERLLYRVPAFRPFTRLMFQWQAAKLARQLVAKEPTAIVHHTSPVSPAVPMFRVGTAPMVIGPVNGNIYFPPVFRHRENWTDWFKRTFHPLVQLGNRLLFNGKRSADVLLVAGGDRTVQSLRMAGCRDDRMVPTLDSGIPDAFASHRPADFDPANRRRFVHSSRLVHFKGAEMIVRALAQTKEPVELTLIGRGPEQAKLERVAAELGVANRVTFVGWVNHADMADTLRQYRAFLFPSMAEANGIVVQEAMLLGLPVVCIDYGGPALLVTNETGVKIPLADEATVVRHLADAMDRLATDDDLARRLGHAGRERAIAEGFRWSDLVGQWLPIYRRLAAAAKG